MFVQSAAPIGWTRITTFNDALLRIVGSGTPSSGGSNGFVATVNSQTGTGTGSTGTGTTGTGTSGGTSLSVANLPSHTHPLIGSSGAGGGVAIVSGAAGSFSQDNVTGGTGSGTAHTHSIPGLSIPALSIPSLSVTFNIKYVDSLIAQKN